MKLIEKLAEDNAPPIGRSYSFEIDRENHRAHELYKIAFKDGFRQALNLALQALSDSDSDPTGFGAGEIRTIGESEVE